MTEKWRTERSDGKIYQPQKPASYKDFKELDYAIMAGFFEIHSELGCHHDEKTYQNRIYKWLKKKGYQAQTEVPLAISHENFEKTYSLDLVIEGYAIYELKAQKQLTETHLNQLLNYLFVAEQQHGKLVNLGTSSVEHKFIHSALTSADRKQIIHGCSEYNLLSIQSVEFRERLINLLSDWGSRLDLNLYNEAITFFMGGETEVVKRINILSDTEVIGTKQVHLLNEKEAFKITALKNPDFVRTHYQKLLNHTKLEAIQWANIVGNNISFITLTREHNFSNPAGSLCP